MTTAQTTSLPYSENKTHDASEEREARKKINEQPEGALIPLRGNLCYDKKQTNQKPSDDKTKSQKLACCGPQFAGTSISKGQICPLGGFG